MRWPPAPLVAILVASMLAAVAWICALPPIQGPDEDSHVAYAQKIAETRSIPWTPGAPPAEPGAPYSQELAYALTFGAVTGAWGNLGARPARTEADVRIWETQDAQLGPDAGADGGFTTAMKNPPLYYLYAALPYLAASGGSIFDRVFAMRLANLPALLAVVVFTWMIAGELLGGRRSLQALATSAVALQPQLIHMTAVVNPDVLLAAVWTAALYLMTIVLRRGPSRARVAGLVALALSSCLTQPRGLAIVVPVTLTLAVAGWRRHRPAGAGQAMVLAAAAALAAAGLAVLVSYALLGDVSPARVRQLGSYTWQFYLPALGFMDPSIGSSYGIGQVLDRFYGGFGMLEAVFPPGVRTWLRVASLAVAVLAVAGVAARWGAVRRGFAVPLVLATAALGYLAVLHAVAFRSLQQSSDPVITGRYLLPLIALYGVLAALAVSWLPRRWSSIAGGAGLAGVVLLQLSAFGVLFARFYA